MSQNTNLIVPDSARIMFGTSWREALAQKESRLRPMVQVRTGCTGNSSTVDIFGKIEMNDVTGQRYRKPIVSDVPTSIRYIYPRELQGETFESRWDQNTVAPLVAPSGKHASAHSQAYNREIDRIILRGLLGDAAEVLVSGGQPTIVALPNSQKIAKDYVASGTAATSGLTIAKLLRALQLLEEAEVYGQDQMESGARLCIATTSAVNKSLLAQVDSTLGSKLMSRDFVPNPVIDASGHIKEFLGITFKRTELVEKVADGGNTVALVPLWCSTSYELDIWEDLTTSIDVRPDLSNALQFLSQAKAGGARIEDDGVVQIACAIS
jgi:hypothetical protein